MPLILSFTLARSFTHFPSSSLLIVLSLIHPSARGTLRRLSTPFAMFRPLPLSLSLSLSLSLLFFLFLSLPLSLSLLRASVPFVHVASLPLPWHPQTMHPISVFVSLLPLATSTSFKWGCSSSWRVGERKSTSMAWTMMTTTTTATTTRGLRLLARSLVRASTRARR